MLKSDVIALGKISLPIWRLRFRHLLMLYPKNSVTISVDPFRVISLVVSVFVL